MTYLLDSNIIIYYLDGDKLIYDFIETNKTVLSWQPLKYLGLNLLPEIQKTFYLFSTD